MGFWRTWDFFSSIESPETLIRTPIRRTTDMRMDQKLIPAAAPPLQHRTPQRICGGDSINFMNVWWGENARTLSRWCGPWTKQKKFEEARIVEMLNKYAEVKRVQILRAGFSVCEWSERRTWRTGDFCLQWHYWLREGEAGGDVVPLFWKMDGEKLYQYRKVIWELEKTFLEIHQTISWLVNRRPIGAKWGRSKGDNRARSGPGW